MATFEVGEIIGNQEGGTPTTLFVTVNTDATTPILYQWLRNGIAIPGAVDATYNFIILPEDSYATYTVFVQNPCGQETSLPSTVGVVSPSVFCKVYECDAWLTAFDAIQADVLLQPMTTEVSQTVLPEYGTWSSYGSGEHTTGVPDLNVQPTYPDYCTAVLPLVHTVTNGVTRHPVNDDALQNIGSLATIGAFVRCNLVIGSGGTYQLMGYTPFNWPMHGWDIVWDPLNGRIRGQFPMASFDFQTAYIQHDSLKGWDAGLTTSLWVHIAVTVEKNYVGDGYFKITVYANGVNVGTTQVTHEITGTYPLTFFNEGKPEDKTNILRYPRWGEQQVEPSATMDARYQYCYFKVGGYSDANIETIEEGYDRSFSTYVDPNPNCTPVP